MNFTARDFRGPPSLHFGEGGAGATLLLPRVAALADAAGSIAAAQQVDPSSLAQMLAGVIVFGLGALAVGVWRFEQRDF